MTQEGKGARMAEEEQEGDEKEEGEMKGGEMEERWWRRRKLWRGGQRWPGRVELGRWSLRCRCRALRLAVPHMAWMYSSR